MLCSAVLCRTIWHPLLCRGSRERGACLLFSSLSLSLFFFYFLFFFRVGLRSPSGTRAKVLMLLGTACGTASSNTHCTVEPEFLLPAPHHLRQAWEIEALVQGGVCVCVCVWCVCRGDKRRRGCVEDSGRQCRSMSNPPAADKQEPKIQMGPSCTTKQKGMVPIPISTCHADRESKTGVHIGVGIR